MPYMLALAQKTQLEGRVSDSQKGEYTVKYAEHTGSNPARMGGVVCAWYVKRDSQCNDTYSQDSKARLYELVSFFIKC